MSIVWLFVILAIFVFIVYEFRSKKNEEPADMLEVAQAVEISVKSSIATASGSSDRSEVSEERQLHTEMTWRVFAMGTEFQKASAYLNRYKEIYRKLTEGLDQEGKRRILSHIEFDRVDGRTVMRKQSNDEKDLVIRLLEFHPPAPSELRTKLYQAFAPKWPQFWMIGKTRYPVEEWDVAQWTGFCSRGQAVSGAEISPIHILSDLNTATLEAICEKFGIQKDGREQPMIDRIVALNLKFDDFRDFIPVMPYRLKIEKSELTEDLQELWEECEAYVGIAKRLK